MKLIALGDGDCGCGKKKIGLSDCCNPTISDSSSMLPEMSSYFGSGTKCTCGRGCGSGRGCRGNQGQNNININIDSSNNKRGDIANIKSDFNAEQKPTKTFERPDVQREIERYIHKNIPSKLSTDEEPPIKVIERFVPVDVPPVVMERVKEKPVIVSDVQQIPVDRIKQSFVPQPERTFIDRIKSVFVPQYEELPVDRVKERVSETVVPVAVDRKTVEPVPSVPSILGGGMYY